MYADTYRTETLLLHIGLLLDCSDNYCLLDFQTGWKSDMTSALSESSQLWKRQNPVIY